MDVFLFAALFKRSRNMTDPAVMSRLDRLFPLDAVVVVLAHVGSEHGRSKGKRH